MKTYTKNEVFEMARKNFTKIAEYVDDNVGSIHEKVSDLDKAIMFALLCHMGTAKVLGGSVKFDFEELKNNPMIQELAKGFINHAYALIDEVGEAIELEGITIENRHD